MARAKSDVIDIDTLIDQETNQITQKAIYDVDTICNFVNKLTSNVIGEKFYNKDAVTKYLSQYSLKEDGTIDGPSLRLSCLQGNRDNRDSSGQRLG